MCYSKNNRAYVASPIVQQQLTFSWSLKNHTRFTLLGMLVLAALFHLAGFYLFKAATPSFQPSPVSSATIYLLTRNSQNYSLLSQWIQAEDPSLFARPANLKTMTLPHISYTPSYNSELHHPVTVLKSPPRISVPLGPAPTLVNLYLPEPQTSHPPAQVAGTRIVLGRGLSGRRIQTLPRGGLLASPSIPSLPITFLAAVGQDGQFRHLFLLHSSGNSELDQNALRNLLHIRLEPVPIKSGVWGTVTYLWGFTSRGTPSPSPKNDSY